MVLNFYKGVLQELQSGNEVVVMAVISSTGSSPGRQGFLMMVTKSSMFGTIGGGMMEHKLVELSRELISQGRFNPFVMHQVHKSDAAKDKSGMICSGEQLIAFYYFDKYKIETIEKICDNSVAFILYNEEGISIIEDSTVKPNLLITDEAIWQYTQSMKHNERVYIFGGGHVGLALCEVLSKLDFEINLFDNRPNLNTMENNFYAHRKDIINYEDSYRYVPEGMQSYVVIMSFGYRTDEIILRSLYGKQFRYIGMMGSVEKIKEMKASLLNEGYSKEYFESMHAPIGIDIKSESAYEIAISVAAQLIAEKNKQSNYKV